jgi:hypothetical protein
VRTGGACRFSAGVNTIVANTTRVHRLAVSVSTCGLQVHPTVPGTGLYPHYGPAQRDWIVGSTVDAAGMNYYFLNAEHQLKLAKIYPDPSQGTRSAGVLARHRSHQPPDQGGSRRCEIAQPLLRHPGPLLLTAWTAQKLGDRDKDGVACER